MIIWWSTPLQGECGGIGTAEEIKQVIAIQDLCADRDHLPAPFISTMVFAPLQHCVQLAPGLMGFTAESKIRRCLV